MDFYSEVLLSENFLPSHHTRSSYESSGSSLQLTMPSKSTKVCRHQPSPFFGLKQLPNVMQAAALCRLTLISNGQRISPDTNLLKIWVRWWEWSNTAGWLLSFPWMSVSIVQRAWAQGSAKTCSTGPLNLERVNGAGIWTEKNDEKSRLKVFNSKFSSFL